MTIASNKRKMDPYICTGAVSSFTFNFPIIREEDLVVELLHVATGVHTVLTYVSDYTVTGVNNVFDGGGTVQTIEFIDGVATPKCYSSDYQIIIYRVTPVTQTSDYGPNIVLNKDALEDDLDKMCMIVQEQYETVDRCIKAPIVDTPGLNMELPGDTIRANQFLAFNSSGEPISSPGTGETPISTYMEPIVQVQTIEELVSTIGGDDLLTALGVTEYAKTILNSETATATREILGMPTDVRFFGVTGDGVTNDKAAILQAVAASNTLYWPEGTYNLGDLSVAGSHIINLADSGDNIEWTTNGKVKFLLNTTYTEGNPSGVICLNNNNNCRFGDFEFEDTGYDKDHFPEAAYAGAYAFLLTAQTAKVENIKIGSITCTSMLACFGAEGVSLTNRVKGVYIDAIYAKDCGYGMCCIDNGDNIVCPLINTDNTNRSYFVYGCSNHDVRIDSKNQVLGSGDVNISRNTVGGVAYNTKNLNIQYKVRGLSGGEITPGQGIINFNHIPNGTAGRIDNVTLDVDIAEITGTVRPIIFCSYSDALGTVEATTTSEWDSIYIKGSSLDNVGPAIYCESIPASKGIIRIDHGDNLLTDQSVHDGFVMGRVSAYTPVWTCVGGPPYPVGSLAGYYTLEGNMCHVKMDMVFTSSPVGAWSFTVPIKSASIGIQTGICQMFDASGIRYVGAVILSGGTDTFEIYPDGIASAAQDTVPFEWVAGDYLTLSISYMIGA